MTEEIFELDRNGRIKLDNQVKKYPTVMMEGEFNSTTAMHNLVPDFVPKPYGWGRFAATPRVYFFVMEFLNMRPTMPNPVVFSREDVYKDMGILINKYGPRHETNGPSAT
ncbi:hypothetical protein HYQ44_003350 [Verticillium longisporum]|nr:hypothetical protein HYQ44_003350 [Verticillium longisporum]